MKDCDKDIRGYHADRVVLTEKQRADLRGSSGLMVEMP